MAKKILALLLILATLSLSACAPVLKDVTGIRPLSGKEKKESGKEEISLPEGFCAGFARGCISPDSFPVKLGNGNLAETVADDLYATCVALSDGENLVLLFAMDIKDVPSAFYEAALDRITKSLPAPQENILINGTHTHNCPHTSSSDYACAVWRQKTVSVMAEVAREALEDLAPAEVFTGAAEAKDFAFVRRYLMKNGTYKGIQSANASGDYLSHETEADPELRVIHFERGEKTDIILANWQAHAAHAASSYPNGISADFISLLREGVESSFDAHFAYFNGASGNLNLTSYVGRQIYHSYREVGYALVDVVIKALETETPAKTGPLQVRSSLLPCFVRQDSAEKREMAKEIVNTAPGLRDGLVERYGFQSQYEAIAVNTRAGMDPVTEVPLFVIAFGDVSLTSNPFELFDTTAREIRAASPFKMTFTCAYTNGSFGYMPPDEIFPHGEYEVYVSRFEAGTAEKCAEEILRMLHDAEN